MTIDIIILIKFIGAGLAAISLAGAGVGIGIIFKKLRTVNFVNCWRKDEDRLPNDRTRFFFLRNLIAAGFNDQIIIQQTAERWALLFYLVSYALVAIASLLLCKGFLTSLRSATHKHHTFDLFEDSSNNPTEFRKARLASLISGFCSFLFTAVVAFTLLSIYWGEGFAGPRFTYQGVGRSLKWGCVIGYKAGLYFNELGVIYTIPIYVVLVIVWVVFFYIYSKTETNFVSFWDKYIRPFFSVLAPLLAAHAVIYLAIGLFTVAMGGAPTW